MLSIFFFISSIRRHTRSVSAFLLNRSSDLNLPFKALMFKTRDGLIRVRNIRALNGRFNTSITHAYSIVIGSKRSEERRVGKECRSRRSQGKDNKKTRATGSSLARNQMWLTRV